MANIPTTIVAAPDYLMGVEGGQPVLVPMNAGLSGGGSTGNLGPAGGAVDPVTGVAQPSVSGAGISAMTGIVRVGNLSRIAAALSAATPAAPAVMLRIGDSTTAGNGAGSGTQWTNSGKRHTSAQFAALTNGLVSSDGFYCDAGLFSSPGMSVYNDQITIGGAWGYALANLGGAFFRLTAGGSGTFRYTLPAGTVKVRFFFLAQGQSITVQTNIGVISTTTLNTGYVEGVDFTMQAGATYIELAGISATVYVCGFYAINATQKAILINAGKNGGLVADNIGSAATYDPLPSLKRIAPKFTIINLTINDANAATAINTYQANLATLVEAALISGGFKPEVQHPGCQ